MNRFTRWKSYPTSGMLIQQPYGALPPDWRVARLKYIAEVVMGQSPSSEDYNNSGDGYPFLQGNAEFGSIHPSPKQYCSTANKVVPAGALLLSVRAPVGALNIADQMYGIGRGLCGILPNRERILQEFAWYLLIVIRNQLNLVATGSTYDAVSREDVANLMCCIPPIPEQRAIADFLDRETARVDALIAKKQRLIELLQEKRSALISHAVTKGLDAGVAMKESGVPWLGQVPAHWRTARIRDVALSLQTGPFGSQLHADEYITDGIPIINPAHLKSGRIQPDRDCTVDQATWLRLARHELLEGDIIFARRGEMGRCALVTTAEQGWLCGSGSLRLRPSRDMVDPVFLFWTLSTDGVAEWLSLESVGTTMDNLSAKIVGQIPLPIPPLSEQRAIADYLILETERMIGLSGKIDTAIEKLREYRTALISAAVTGKIDVREEAAS